MKYKIEILIIIIIFSIITILDVFTHKNMEYIVDKYNNKLQEVSINLNRTNFELSKIIDIKNEWEKDYKILALYIEHDELEKIGNVISKLNSNVENKEKENSLENIKEIKFLLTHIQNKSILNIQNVF